MPVPSNRIRLSFGYSVLLLACCSGLWLPLLGSTLDFNTSVRPILAEHCFECHGPDGKQRKADLRLDEPPGKLDLREGKAAIVPGDSDASELIQRIRSSDPDLMMPPPEAKKRLTKEEIKALSIWIQQGAEYQRHWAFEPIPMVSGHLGKRNPSDVIDEHIRDRLEAVGLSLSKPASKVELIRRATFDLTGLPPQWENVQAFLEDDTPLAFEKVIDRLLESSAYGERWGRHWLDLARYADTYGASAIGFKRFPFSYTYRDYVVAAFNNDLPYDRFILEQIAADQLGLSETDPALAALGFLTVGRQFRNRHDVLDDQIDVITRGLLGLTVACARCHDHKFDAIPTADYYSLHATLANSFSPNELPLVGEPVIAASYEDELKHRRRHRDDLVHEQGIVMRNRLRMQVGLYLEELAKGTPEQDTSTTFLSYRTDELRPVVLEKWRRYLNQMDRDDPVFGAWHRLAKIGEKNFRDRAMQILRELEEQNGDPKKFEDQHRFSTSPPRWNPRVLQALKDTEPESMIEVAGAYGRVFETSHRLWLREILAAADEASSEGEVVADEDAKHRVINSGVERQLRHHLLSPESPTAVDFTQRPNLSMLNRGVTGPVSGAFDAIDTLNLEAHSPARAMALRESDEIPAPAFVFERGNPIQRGQPVKARFLTALDQVQQPLFSDGKRRLGLAEAIVDAGNPLTRRVIVNWVWLHHFNQGLVTTPDDFGTRGRTPSHPELLDFLAGYLSRQGWSLKRLHKAIMLSEVYQQSARERREAREADPENRWLWRMPTRKLEMEAMRDALLFVSGELESEIGGRPFEEGSEKTIPRRTLYAFVNRDVISNWASTFDAANPSTCTLKRSETMVPQQTLFALNSDYVQARAVALIDSASFAELSDVEERILFLYRRLFSRPPSPVEMTIGSDYVLGHLKGEQIWTQYVHALLASNEFHFID